MIRRYFKLFVLFMRISVQQSAAYRLDFFTHAFLAIGQAASELFGLWIIYSNTDSLAGWNSSEMLALLGVFRIVIGIITLIIAPNMQTMMDEIRKGTFDYVVLKPINSQFYVSVRRVVFWRLADVAVGVGMIAYAVNKLSLDLSTLRIAAFLLMLGCGAVIVYCVWLALATTAFWFTRIANIEMVFWNLFEAGRYPVDIFRPWIRWGLTYVIPLAMLTTLPAATLLGRTGPWHVVGAILLATITLILASWFWRVGLKRYTGASA